jgi:hypothetical protein
MPSLIITRAYYVGYEQFNQTRKIPSKPASFAGGP